MKRKKFTPFEGFTDNPGIEKLLILLEGDGILSSNQRRDGIKELMGRYNITINTPIPKTNILRIDSTENTFLLDQTLSKESTNIFTVFNVGEQVPYIEYQGFSVNETISLFRTGEIVFPQVCKFRENGELKDAMGYFVILELPLAEKGSTKTYDELYRPDRVYTFLDLLQDILAAKELRAASGPTHELKATLSDQTIKAIEKFLKPFYEEEQQEITLDLQMFNNIPPASVVEDLITFVPTGNFLDADFLPYLHGPSTTAISEVSTRYSTPSINDEGDAVFKKGNTSVYIDNFETLTSGLTVSTHKLLDTAILYLTQQNEHQKRDKLNRSKINPKVEIPLEDFRSLSEPNAPNTKTSKDAFRRKVKGGINALYKISIEHTGGDRDDFRKVRLVGDVGIVKGVIHLEFSRAIAEYLSSSYITYYPKPLLGLDDRQGNAYYIGGKLSRHNSINNNQGKGTNNIISINALLKAVPDIPLAETVDREDRHFNRRIKAPLENGLNTLIEQDILSTWKYCGKKKAALTIEQVNKMPFADFMEQYIYFEIKNAPKRKRKKTELEEDPINQ